MALAPAALAGALLYGMYKISSSEDDRLVRPAAGSLQQDEEMTAQLITSGIPTQMLLRGMAYSSERNFAGSGEEDRPIRYNGPEGIARYSTGVIQDLNQIYAREIFNDYSVTFQVPAPTIKPTFVYYTGDYMPGVSPDYAYSQISDPLPKVGRAEDPN